MSEKFFGHSMNSKEHIKQELDDAGISHPSEWREAVHFEDDQEKVVIENPELKVEAIKTGEINNESWQQQLDTAFQRNDYELIKTLRKVRPQSAPSAELIQARIRELVSARPSKWVEDFGSIKSISSDIELDQALVAEEFGKLFEKFAQEKGVLEQLKEFKRATGYVPSPEDVQSKYRSIFAGKKSYNFDTEDLVKDIKGLTGLQPDKALFQEAVDSGDILQAKKIAPLFGVEVTSEMIQQAYEMQFEKKGYLDTYRISEIGEKPNQALVKKAYQKIVEKRGDRWMDAIKSLEQATGIKPVFTKEQMNPIFEEFLQRGWYGQKGYVGIEHLTEMTGMRPSVDLVEKAALKIVDGGHSYIDQGKAIIEGLKRLQEGVGVVFEIPEAEIQDRYLKAIADKKAHVISNLHGALGIRPSVDKEVARQFMVGFMDETYHNPISELEKVFGVKFKATDEEIEAKQDESLQKLRFDNLLKIKELTGKDYDKERVQASLLGLLEKEALYPPHERGDFTAWEKNIKQRFEQFGITPTQEEIVPIYEKFIENQTIYSSDLGKVYKLTGVPLPADLAQRAYQKILSLSYISYGVSKSKSTYSYGQSEAITVILEASGVRPELPVVTIQQYYRAKLQSGWSGVREIQKVAEITEVKPEFDPQDIQNLYRGWILSGKEDYIKQVKEITGIELQLDESTLTTISQQLEDGINKVRSENYEKEKSYSKEKEFDSYGLEQDLRKVSSLTAATGVKPNIERLQSAYSEILTSDPYWNTKIEQLVEATGIKPGISAELIQAKGQQLLEQGALRSFQRLQEYGQFNFTPEIAEKAYAGLLATSQSQDEYERRSYYNEDWMERIKRFRELSGIPPTDSQLSEIFGHMVKDGKIARRSYNRISDIAELFEKDFGAKISEEMAAGIYKELFVAGNFKDIEEFKKKTGIVPEISTDIVREKSDDLLQKRDFQTLSSVKTILGLETLPITPEVVQAEYMKLVENPKFATYSDKDVETFYAVYELTQVRPELSSEQIAMVYRRAMFASYDGSYEKFERVVGVPPTESDLQNRIYNWLVEDYMRKENVTKFMEKYKVAVSPEIANKAVMRRLEKTGMGKFTETIKTIKLIEEISGSPVRLEVSVVENATQKILETHKPTEYSCTELDDLFSWFEESTGQKPSQGLVDLAYTKTLGQTISYEKTPSGKNLQAWDWLKQRYGLPTPQAVQKIYLAQLASK